MKQIHALKHPESQERNNKSSEGELRTEEEKQL